MMAHLANVPMIPLVPMPMPTSSSNDNFKEIAFKTVPSASKPEIKLLLQSIYGFEVRKVRTLNMKGKKKNRGGSLVAKPDYKKAYVTLKKPLSFSHDLHPLRARTIQEDKNEKMLSLQY